MTLSLIDWLSFFDKILVTIFPLCARLRMSTYCFKWVFYSTLLATERGQSLGYVELAVKVGMRFDFQNFSRGSKEIGTDSFTSACIFAGGIKATYIISKYLWI